MEMIPMAINAGTTTEIPHPPSMGQDKSRQQVAEQRATL
jgi:hypothetical protein